MMKVAADWRVLVTAATGTMGREVVRALLERGASVRVLVRSLERAAHLPAQVDRAVGDLRDPAALQRALSGMRAAFWLAPHDPDKERLAAGMVRACAAAGVRLVYAGDHIDIPYRLPRHAAQWFYGRKYPHYAASFRIGEVIFNARTERLLLVPTTFAQNDELFRDEILAGEYPLPYRRVAPVDVRDIGDAVARALLDQQTPTGVFTLTGPAALSGEQCAATWSEVLGREVRYTGADVASFIQLLEKKLSGAKLADWKQSFRLLSKLALPAPTQKQVEQTTHLLGRAPRSYRDYVRDASAAWQSAGLASELQLVSHPEGRGS